MSGTRRIPKTEITGLSGFLMKGFTPKLYEARRGDERDAPRVADDLSARVAFASMTTRCNTALDTTDLSATAG